jgi:hypothetical protein
MHAQKPPFRAAVTVSANSDLRLSPGLEPALGTLFFLCYIEEGAIVCASPHGACPPDLPTVDA